MRDLTVLNKIINRAKNFDIFKKDTKITAERLLKIAQDNPEGFTIDINCNHKKSGYAVGIRETQNSFGYEGAKRVVNKAIEFGYDIGGWFDVESNQYYFDAVIVMTIRKYGIELGLNQGQKSIFDLENKKQINLTKNF